VCSAGVARAQSVDRLVARHARLGDVIEDVGGDAGLIASLLNVADLLRR
jgi:hypothetical protein